MSNLSLSLLRSALLGVFAALRIPEQNHRAKYNETADITGDGYDSF